MTDTAPTIINSDAVQWAREYSGPPHHAMLCDPPYHLTSIVKRFGKTNAKPAQEGSDGAFRRAAAGFMGQEWDGGDLAFQPETWDAFAHVLYPGAFCMAFASSRGFHRMAVAIEDAGFILHPFIGYAFGQGFPKATRIADERFSGHRYGGQAMKPALEPILVFQKPYQGKPIECITVTGAGALNIDAGRTGIPPELRGGSGKLWSHYREDAKTATPPVAKNTGRWPANLILQGDACDMIDRQSGIGSSGHYPIDRGESGYKGGFSGQNDLPEYKTSGGGASRFFFRVQEQIDECDPVLYHAKVGRGERDAGMDEYDRQPLEWSSGAGKPGAFQSEGTDKSARNNHPTLKPLSLTRYLASLLLPPPEFGPRRLFVPFAGVASEMCGAHLAGWEQINGVEQSARYCGIGDTRLRFWSCNAGLFESFSSPSETLEPGQESLFEAFP